jgi:hypothetical protein
MSKPAIDEQIRPVAFVNLERWLSGDCCPDDCFFDVKTGDIEAPVYDESALAQAEEKGRIAGMREAAKIVLNGRFLHDNAPTKLFANEAAAAIIRAAEGK